MSDTPDSNSVEFVPLNLPYDGNLLKKNTAHESVMERFTQDAAHVYLACGPQISGSRYKGSCRDLKSNRKN